MTLEKPAMFPSLSGLDAAYAASEIGTAARTTKKPVCKVNQLWRRTKERGSLTPRDSGVGSAWWCP